jgi:hypothetical protein
MSRPHGRIGWAWFSALLGLNLLLALLLGLEALSVAGVTGFVGTTAAWAVLFAVFCTRFTRRK